MNRRKTTWFGTVGVGFLLSTGGCAWLQSSPSPPIDQVPQTTAAVAEPPVHQTCTEGKPDEGSVDEHEGLTLVRAIQIALAANPDLRSASARVEIAAGALSRARAEFFPRLALGQDVAGSNNQQTVFGFLLSQGKEKQVFSLNPDIPNTYDNFHTQLSFTEDLYTGGRRLAQKRSAEASLEASRFALAEVQNELVFEVAEAYYRLLQAREFLQVRRQAVDQVKRQLDVVTARVRAGSAVKSDQGTVEVRLAEVEEALISARNEQELAWALLEKVLGTHVAPHALPEGVPAAPWSEHVDQVEAIVTEATARRPELGKLSSNKQAAEQDVRAAQAARYPSVNVTSSYDVNTADLVTGNESFYVGVGVRLLLADFGRTTSEVRQAKARLQEIYARQASAVLDIELDVRRAYLRLADAQERLRVTSKAVSLAEENLKEMEARYRGQQALLTQVIDTQVALSNASVRRANVAADVEIARAQLERAAGRLTSFPGSAPRATGSP